MAHGTHDVPAAQAGRPCAEPRRVCPSRCDRIAGAGGGGVYAICSDVHNLLLEEGIRMRSCTCRPVHYGAARGRAPGVDTAEVVKSLVFYMDDEPTLVLVPGSTVADEDASGPPWLSHVRLAKAQEVLAVTGTVGAGPPRLATSCLWSLTRARSCRRSFTAAAPPPPCSSCAAKTCAASWRRAWRLSRVSSEGATTTWVAVPRACAADSKHRLAAQGGEREGERWRGTITLWAQAAV